MSVLIFFYILYSHDEQQYIQTLLSQYARSNISQRCIIQYIPAKCQNVLYHIIFYYDNINSRDAI